jgi:hypothetical protein
MHSLKSKLVGVVMGLLGLLMISKRRKRLSPQQLHRMDFKSSAQKIGVHLPETLRDRFRHRWLRLK